ncbi:hypothetical protein KY285_026313 [Solanum tuberosum]|nr:hypothetical protein KY285_026313 [Solanum tuberosum]
MPPRRAVRGRPARRNVEEQGVPNAPEVQPQGEVTNAEFREAIIIMFEFLWMNPPSFTGSSTTEDPEHFIEELLMVFKVMDVADVEQVELGAYQLKSIARTWFDQWKKGRAKGAPILSWATFEEVFLGCFFPHELREAKMVADMRSKMSLFIAGLSRMPSKEGKVAMLIGVMDIARLIVYVQQVVEEKLRDIEEFKNKKAKTGNESGQQRSNVNHSSFQHKKNGPTLSSAGAPVPKNKGEYNSQNFRARLTQSQGSVAQGGNWAPTCAKCGRNHPCACRDGSTGCFKCSQEGHFIKECHKTYMAMEIGAIEPNLLQLLHHTGLHLEELLQGLAEEKTAYMRSIIIKSKRILQMLSLVYAFLDPGSSLYFVTPYVAMNFDVLPEKLCEPDTDPK